MFRTSQHLQRLAPRASRFASVPSLLRSPVLLQHSQSPLVALSRASSSPLLALQVASFASKSDSDADHKKKVIEEALKPRPSEVSTTSSTRQTIETAAPTPATTTSTDPDVSTGLQHDIGIVRDTFRLDTVPRESHILGLAGTVPYLVTSVSTLFLSWDLTKDLPTGNAFFDYLHVNHDTAHYLLNLMEPLQLGYGAVIISFLGAIHWGLEYAEKQPLRERTQTRYAVGVVAPMVAWSSIYMPLEYALTTQFMAFVGLYFFDARAATRGWAPKWYSTYRFLLTAMVGLAIFISLAGRAKISQEGRLTTRGIRSSLSTKGIADHETNWAKLEAEEKEKIKKQKEEAEKKAKKEAEKKEKAEKSGKKKGKKEGGDKDKNGAKEQKDEGKEKDDDKDKKDDASEEEDEGDEENDDKEESGGGDEEKGDDEKKAEKQEKKDTQQKEKVDTEKKDASNEKQDKEGESAEGDKKE